MRSDDFLTLPVPQLPRARYVARGYYTSAYFTVGPNDGRPLVLCHGLAASGLQFVADANAYAQMGFRVIVPDLRGHGRSKMPDRKIRRNEDFTIKALADDLIAILDAEQVKSVNWVGNSLGAILAVKIIENQPQRILRLVAFGAAFPMEMNPFYYTAMILFSRLVRRKHLNELGARLGSKIPASQAIIYAMLKQGDRQTILRIARQSRKLDFFDLEPSFDGQLLLLQRDGAQELDQDLGPLMGMVFAGGGFFNEEYKDFGHFANLDHPEIMRKEIAGFTGSITADQPGSAEM